MKKLCPYKLRNPICFVKYPLQDRGNRERMIDPGGIIIILFEGPINEHICTMNIVFLHEGMLGAAPFLIQDVSDPTKELEAYYFEEL